MHRCECGVHLTLEARNTYPTNMLFPSVRNQFLFSQGDLSRKALRTDRLRLLKFLFFAWDRVNLQINHGDGRSARQLAACLSRLQPCIERLTPSTCALIHFRKTRACVREIENERIETVGKYTFEVSAREKRQRRGIATSLFSPLLFLSIRAIFSRKINHRSKSFSLRLHF
jgi:hypothetical protein